MKLLVDLFKHLFDIFDTHNYWNFVNMTFETIDNHCDLTIKSKHCNVYQSQTGEHNPKAKVTEDDDDTLGSWADVFSGCVMCIKQWSYPGSPYSVLYAYRVPARPPPPSQWAIKSATFSYCQGGKPVKILIKTSNLVRSQTYFWPCWHITQKSSLELPFAAFCAAALLVHF